MKKVILTGVALMGFAAVSFAQNSATLNQIGNTQSGNATQSGNNNTSNIQQTTASGITNIGNYANTNQNKGNGDVAGGNDAFVNQLGTKSGVALIEQVEGNLGAKNSATINQKNNSGGNGNLYTPGNSSADVRANGGNYASTAQLAFRNEVLINQNDESKGNIATSNQANFGAGQSVTINQNNQSTNNTATANQFGDNNTLSISQSNNSIGNTANVRQGYSQAGPPGQDINTFGATATVEQNGILNGGSSSGNEATILQVNAEASANIQQNAGSGFGAATDGSSTNNLATINQSNSNGDASIQQNNASGTFGRNEARIDQTAGDHTANITQNNDSQRNLATINQSASGNDLATINQSNFSGNGTAKINQGGGGLGTNTAFIEMKNQTNSPSDVTINQNMGSGDAGKNNVARVYQGLDGNAPDEVALGTSGNNHALINQHGNDNIVNQYQVGVNNRSTISQTGSDNVVKGTASFRNADFAAQLGQNNTLMVTQSGLGGNTAAVFQSGSGNSGMINQTNN